MKNKSAYHWLVAFTGFVCIFMASGVCNTSFSTVSVYLFDFWGISNMVYGTMVSVRTFASVAGIAFVSVYYRKLSYRWGLALSLLFGAAGWVFFWSGSGKVFMGYLGSILLGLCRGIGGSVAVTILINRWFNKYKGALIGICMAASGLATSIMPKILVPIVENYSLTTYFLLMIAMFTAVAAFIAVAVRDDPKCLNLRPYGDDELSGGNQRKKTRPHDYAAGPRELILLYISSVYISATLTIFTNFNSAALKTLGWEAVDIADVTFWFGIFLMVSKPIYGFMCDRFRPEYIVCGGICMSALGTFMMSFDQMPFYGKAWVVLSFLVWSGGAPGSSAGFGIYAMDLAPKEAYAAVVKNQTLIWNISNMILSPISGGLADMFGSYRALLYIMTGISVLHAVTMWVVYRGARGHYQSLHTTTGYS